MLVALHAKRTTWDVLERGNYTFVDYITEFEKVYAEDEYPMRKGIFVKNLKTILTHNADLTMTWKMGVNQFTDMTAKEFKRYRGLNRAMLFSSQKTRTQDRLKQPPIKHPLADKVDWRTASPAVLTPVKNQGNCGSCWAFAATESIESAIAISKKQAPPVLSAQEIVDCTPNPNHCGGTGGCEGAICQLAFNYTKDGGLTLEKDYKYTGRDGKCKESTMPKIQQNVNGYVDVKSNDQAALMAAVTLLPVAISVAAEPWQMYERGVFDGCRLRGSGTVIDHAVQVVGYDDTDSKNAFWIVRNSWGKTWGIQGYIELKKYNGEQHCGTDKRPSDGDACENGPKTENVCGECGILFDNSYPTIA